MIRQKRQTCIKCESPLLLGENWTDSRRKKHHYICKGCFNFQFKQRVAYKNERKTTNTWYRLDKKLTLKVRNFMLDSVKRDRKVEFSFIEISEIMKKPCFYCGKNDGYVGIDRKNSSLDYIKGNVVPSCTNCNVSKKQSSVEEYYNHCKKVVNHMEGNLGKREHF